MEVQPGIQKVLECRGAREPSILSPPSPTEILSGVIRSVKKDGEWKVGARQSALSKPRWGSLNVGPPPRLPEEAGRVWDGMG